MSRRLAFKASLGVDQTLVFFNSSAPLLIGQGRNRDTESDGTVHFESTGDVSYSQSRTKTGRFVAALVLIFGGAIGAALYEVVGRPAELMRLVIWEGRKAWEEGRRGTKRDSWKNPKGRLKVTGARRRERIILESAGKEMMKGSFLNLRCANRSGTRLSKVQGAVLQRTRKPSHPLKLHAISTNTKNTSEESVMNSASVEKQGRKRRTALKLNHKIKSHSSIPQSPSLGSRPSAYTLLVEHAQRTSILRFTSNKNMMSQTQPTPVPTSILLFHTYFIAPFSPHPSSVLQRSPLEKGEAAKTITGQTTKDTVKRRFTFGNLLHFKYPTSNAPGSVKSISQAQVWGNGRLAWAFRRLASPYSIGFLAFAWMSGDLA